MCKQLSAAFKMQLLRKCWKDKQLVNNGEGRESNKDKFTKLLYKK